MWYPYFSKTNVILFVVLLFGISHAGRAQPIPLLNKALDASWSEPVPVINDSSTRLPLFNVTFAETSQGIHTFGTPQPMPEQYTTAVGRNFYNGEERLIAVNPHRKRMPVPEGDFTFAYPTALADSAGAIHLLWAEPNSSDEDMIQYQIVWYARYTNGTWSEPTAVYRSERLRWDTDSKSNFTVDSRGVLHLAFIADKKKPGGTTVGFTHLYKNESGWHHNFSASKRAWACGYLDLIAADSGTLHMTCIGPDFDSRGDINSVFFSSSTDNGQSWSKPVDLDPRQPAFSFEITADTNDRFHLVYSSIGANKLSTWYKMWDGNRWKSDTVSLLSTEITHLASTLLLTQNNRLRFVLTTFESPRPQLPGNALYLEKRLEE